MAGLEATVDCAPVAGGARRCPVAYFASRAPLEIALAPDSQKTSSPPANGAILRAEGLTKVYRTGDVEVHALRGVDLALAQRELIVLLGPSGSGKSTLLNILGGLDTPTAGHVWFHDRELTARDEAGLTAYRRLHVGFVFQFYNLIPSLTALENVALVTEIAADPMPARDALARVGLGERTEHFPSQLSGGEQQRVAIARAIAKQPDVLMCDEPTGALDAHTGRVVLQVLDALETINRDLGTTTLVITHNADIARLAHRVLYLGDGRITRETVNATRVPALELSW